MKKFFDIIWEDDFLMVVNKKGGLLTIPDRYNDDKVNLYSLLMHYRKKIYPLHRLDRDTSGVLVYAKDEATHKAMSEKFEKRHIYKEYLALVNGHPHPESGRIETNLAKSDQHRHKVVVSKKGKLAITEYEIIEKYQSHALLKVIILTGRQHQIRVHMQHIGHSLAVDALYGNKNDWHTHEIKTRKFIPNKRRETKPLISRHTLHAHTIAFEHPIEKREIRCTAPIPKDLKAVINQLSKWQNIKN